MASKAIPLISIYFCEATELDVMEKLKALTSENEAKDKAQVLQYLEGGLLWERVWTIVPDLLSPDGKWIDAPDVLTDGVWAWSREVIHYLKHYNLRLPPAFVEHMRKRGWVMREIDLRRLFSMDTETIWPQE
jgi:hypothetical protein